MRFTEIAGNRIGRVTTSGEPVLTISKSAPASVISGQDLTYTITYGNTGSDNDNATGVAINDTLPSGTSFVHAGPAHHPRQPVLAARHLSRERRHA